MHFRLPGVVKRNALARMTAQPLARRYNVVTRCLVMWSVGLIVILHVKHGPRFWRDSGKTRGLRPVSSEVKDSLDVAEIALRRLLTAMPSNRALEPSGQPSLSRGRCGERLSVGR